MQEKELKTMEVFLKWLVEKLGNYPDPKVRLNRAKQLARELWDEFGYEIVKKTLKERGCVTIRDFERLALQIRELPKKQPVWTPPS